jgi:2-polyprenyl-6-methoxyphenol hydroxylase-like FAD-dependent oxidoreductase
MVVSMSPRSVLISGGGVAGPTLACWLARHGFQPTVVERSQGLRSSGNPVDVRGPALPVAEAMREFHPDSAGGRGWCGGGLA